MTGIRTAVVGVGTIAKYYLRAIETSPTWELAALCDSHAERPHNSETPFFRDHRDLLRETSLDALIVTTPNDVHAMICRDALHAGIPVCVEKPLAVSLREGREVASLSRTRALLFTAFHRRYNDNVLRLLRQVRSHGGIESMTVRYLELIEEHIGSDTWYLTPRRCGGGCVADNGPNAFDLVRMFLGDVEVVRSTVERDDHGIDRKALVELRSGTSTATVHLDWSFAGETKDVEVVCDDGTRLRADMLAGHTGFKSSLWHEYVGILDDFAASIAAGARPHDGGLPALELVLETYERERTGTPVPGRKAT